jgi:N-methylhydantoinase B/oxoprolinase/acetone carboxylase alpha subunit
MTDTSTRFDPITLEIIQTSLQATSDEMFAAMRRTAMSAIIYEVLDMGTGITDADGQLASSGAGIPASSASSTRRSSGSSSSIRGRTCARATSSRPTTRITAA